ncbi:MAG: N-acetylmuramoyl-L-alanine amidase, partial [Alphaproteobacteria bacterium]
MKFGWTADWAALHKRYMFLSLALASTIALSVPGSAGGISGVFVQNDRVVVRFDDRVNGASAFLLDAPRRIALDIDGAQVGRGHFAPASSAVSAVRQGQL